MSVSMELLSPGCSSLLSKRPSFCSSSSMALFAPSLKFQSFLLKPSGHRLSFESPRAFVPKGLGVGVGFRSGNLLNRQILYLLALTRILGIQRLKWKKKVKIKN
uniref:Uncharacterized protein n=1 Tax=Salix viminalis TaxID=40686 RepID=A0A6N2KMD2_SALVM